MPAGRQKYILGERFWRWRDKLNKAEACTAAYKEREAGYHVQLERVARGNYTVWTTRLGGNL